MDEKNLAGRLMATFLGEVEDQTRAMNHDLLALEKGPGPAERSELVRSLFRSAHSLKGASRAVNAGTIEKACHALEGILAGVRDGLVPLDKRLFAILYKAADALEDAGKRLKASQPLKGAAVETIVPRLQEAAGRREEARSSAAKPAGPTALGGSTVAAEPSPPAWEEPVKSPGDRAFIRLPAGKLDNLLALSGELLVARLRSGARAAEVSALKDMAHECRNKLLAVERMLKDSAGGDNRANSARGASPSAGEVSEVLNRLGRGLDRLSTALTSDNLAVERAADAIEEEVLEARMMPFAEACEGLDRVVRDLAESGGKEIALSIAGGNVQVDRAVIEGLKSPLRHLVRNAAGHGIEGPAGRLAAGKPPGGRITVSALLRGDRVEVRVADDGQGIDLGAIRAEALRRGVEPPGDERELARLIFVPGFTTARGLTEISGRGVGLDAVRTGTEALRGSVDFSFDRGKGTKFTLNVPLTLTTVRALLVQAAGHVFAFDAAAVDGVIGIGAGDVRLAEGREVILDGGFPVPVSPLAAILGLRGKEVARAGGKVPAVLLRAGGRRAAVSADGLEDVAEVVVKSLGGRLKRLRFASAAAVLPTGQAAFLLNAAEVVREVYGRTPEAVLVAALSATVPERRKRLLLAEDSVTTRALERSILEAAGYEVTAVADGAEAWEELQVRGADLVVADVEMPRLDGIALTETIRASKRFRDLPVILVTAMESDRDKGRGNEAGADAYILKSTFDQRVLLETIGQLL